MTDVEPLSAEEQEWLSAPVIYVPSETTKELKYMVTRPAVLFGEEIGWSCSCPSFRFNKAHNPDNSRIPTCKHIKAATEYTEELKARNE